MRQRRDPARSFLEAVDGGETGEMVLSVDVHCAGTAHALPARPPERECRIDLVIDLDQGIEDHRPTMVPIYLERIQCRIRLFVRIPNIQGNFDDP